MKNNQLKGLDRRTVMKSMGTTGLGLLAMKSINTASAATEISTIDSWADNVHWESTVEPIRNRELVASLELDDIYTRGDRSLYHFAGSMWGWVWRYIYPNSGREVQTGVINAHSSEIRVNTGSLYPNQNPEEVGHYPDSGGGISEDVGSLGYTALKAAISLAANHPYVTAATAADSLIREFVHDSNSVTELSNTQEYEYDYTNFWGAGGVRSDVCNTFDFYIEGDMYEWIDFNVRTWVKSGPCSALSACVTGGGDEGGEALDTNFRVYGVDGGDGGDNDAGQIIAQSPDDSNRERVPAEVIESNPALQRFADSGKGDVYKIRSPDISVDSRPAREVDNRQQSGRRSRRDH